MPADDFSLKPNWVHPLEPTYNNVITQSESMKKEFLNLSTTGEERFRLEYKGLTDANFKTLYDHYKGRYGGYDSFLWLNAYIPAYILTLLGLTSENLEGRWVDGTFKFIPKSSSWDAEITFEKKV